MGLIGNADLLPFIRVGRGEKVRQVWVRVFFALVVVLAVAGQSRSAPLENFEQEKDAEGVRVPPVPALRSPDFEARHHWDVARICQAIAENAAQHDLPPAFFTRLIWKESRFDIRAISPVGAQGIAQFMPETARLRGLEDPFDPGRSIAESARFLADLRARFGNLGLAAAAYNGGPDRVERFVAHRGGLPWETIDYVHSITFRPAEWFREPGREVEPRPLDPKRSFAEACQALPVIKTRSVFGGAQMKPWGVQVAGGVTYRAAARAYERVRRAHRGTIGGYQPLILRTRRAGGGAHYNARIGANSRAEAYQICLRLRNTGGNCVVRRN